MNNQHPEPTLQIAAGLICFCIAAISTSLTFSYWSEPKAFLGWLTVSVLSWTAMVLLVREKGNHNG